MTLTMWLYCGAVAGMKMFLTLLSLFATVVCAQDGGLSGRAKRPVGRSSYDPQRIAEQQARAARAQQGQVQPQLTPDARIVAIGEAVKQAIAQRRMLVIMYDNEAVGVRLIEPHLLGVTTAGNWAVQAWFVGGASASGEGPGWRNYRLDRIVDLKLSDRFFAGPRPGFNPTGGPAFSAVQTSLGGAAVIPIR